MWIYIGIYVNLIVRVCAHRLVCSYMYIVLHILQSQASKHAHRHVRTHVHTHTHARAHSTHVNMFIITNKRSSLYIQTVFSLACLLYCKGGNLYSTRVLPLYLFNVFFFYVDFFSCTCISFICLSVFFVEYMSLWFSL